MRSMMTKDEMKANINEKTMFIQQCDKRIPKEKVLTNNDIYGFQYYET